MRQNWVSGCSIPRSYRWFSPKGIRTLYSTSDSLARIIAWLRSPTDLLSRFGPKISIIFPFLYTHPKLHFVELISMFIHISRSCVQMGQEPGLIIFIQGYAISSGNSMFTVSLLSVTGNAALFTLVLGYVPHKRKRKITL